MLDGEAGIEASQTTFLRPIVIAGATALQDWGYDPLFEASVVGPLNVGGCIRVSIDPRSARLTQLVGGHAQRVPGSR